MYNPRRDVRHSDMTQSLKTARMSAGATRTAKSTIQLARLLTGPAAEELAYMEARRAECEPHAIRFWLPRDRLLAGIEVRDRFAGLPHRECNLGPA
jgi:hypothetical protein